MSKFSELLNDQSLYEKMCKGLKIFYSNLFKTGIKLEMHLLVITWNTIPVSSLDAIDDEYAFHRFVGKDTTFGLRRSVWQYFEKQVQVDVLDSMEIR